MTPIPPEALGEGAVLRIQDEDGRGPYRPGLSAQWSDPVGPLVAPWWIEIGEDMETAHARMSGPYHWGCGFRTGDQMRAWFSAKELGKLNRLGFAMVRVIPDVIIAETPTQVVFGSSFPLANARPRISLVSRVAEAA